MTLRRQVDGPPWSPPTRANGWASRRPGEGLGMRVMDFYRLDGDLIAENWVPIDIIHVLCQLGVDVFARMRHLAGHPDPGLLR